ncbi:MAG TPA: UbiA-like polyprenyltransferase [Bacteroidales bacterium]|nr:UbiA-like polyprenyltransferase [Bacteroidales bacterium]
MNDLIKKAGNYFSLVKFSHTVFAMPFALIGFTLAVTRTENESSLKLLVLVILCMIFARNAAMSFNRLADRKIDARNPRTEKREIPSGKIGVKQAAAFVIINSILFVTTTGFINRLTLFLSPVALLVILGYSLTKRFTFLCHFILGLGLSLAPIGAYISVTGQFHPLPLIYSFIVLTWVSGFDIIYALQDDEFDRKNSLHSLPSAAGRRNALVVSLAVHVLTVILVAAAGIAGSGDYLYWTGAMLFTAMIIYQHTLVRPDDLSRVTLAFQTANGIASVLYGLFVILDLILL